MKRSFFVSGLFVASVSFVLAGQFWDERAFGDWTDAEAEKLLNKSPWSAKISILVGGSGGGGFRGGGGMPSAGGSGAPPLGGGGGPGGGEGAGGGGGVPSGAGGPGRGLQEMNFTLRWESARPIREAAVRRRFGAEAASIEEAKQILDAPVPTYAISLLGFPARMVQRNAAAVAAAASLVPKGRDPIKASKVEAIPGEPPPGLVFQFPRTDPITLDDKEVEFRFEFGPMKMRRKFKLQKMLYKGKLEL